jgi:hypothetical protein
MLTKIGIAVCSMNWGVNLFVLAAIDNSLCNRASLHIGEVRGFFHPCGSGGSSRTRSLKVFTIQPCLDAHYDAFHGTFSEIYDHKPVPQARDAKLI